MKNYEYVFKPTQQTLKLDGIFIATAAIEICKNINVDEPFIWNAATLDNNWLNIGYECSEANYPIETAVGDILSEMTGESNIWKIAGIVCNEDIEWGEKRNEGYRDNYYYKFTLKPEYAKKIKAAIETWIKGLETLKTEMDAEESNEKAECKARQAALKCEILHFEKGTPGEGGIDPSALVRLTDPITGESLKFNCRNIFDFGYVVNPNYPVAEGHEPGGFNHNGYWQDFDTKKCGWYSVRELTPFEKRCIDYLTEFPPIYSGIRM
jgi:hypothetical protein